MVTWWQGVGGGTGQHRVRNQRASFLVVVPVFTYVLLSTETEF